MPPDYGAALAYLEADEERAVLAFARTLGYGPARWSDAAVLRDLVFTVAVARLADADRSDRDELPRLRDACGAFGCREDADQEARKIRKRLKRWGGPDSVPKRDSAA